MPSKMVKVFIDCDENSEWVSYTKSEDWPKGHPYHRRTLAEVPEKLLKEYDETADRMIDLMDKMKEYIPAEKYRSDAL